MEISHLIVYGLATWRIGSLLVREDGPFRIFRRIREWSGILHTAEGDPYMIPDGFFPEVFSCVWCSSVWIGLFLSVFWFFSPEWSLRLSVPFAFSGLAILLDGWIKHE